MPGATAGLIGVAVAALLMVLTAAARQPARRDIESGRYILEYPALFRILGLFSCIVMPLLLIVLVIIVPFKNPEDPYAAGGMFAFFFLLGLSLYLESKSRVELDDKELSAWSLWRGARTIPWNKVDDVTFSGSSQWFTVVSNTGTRIRVHTMMRGIDNFREMLAQRVRAEKLARVQAFL